jgi:hypothetical protein
MIGKLLFIYRRFGISVYIPAVIISTVIVSSLVYVIKNFVLERKSGLFDGKVT